MGSRPWEYYVPYRDDIAAAMEDLKQQEFAAGRYNKGWDDKVAKTIAEAIVNSDAEGTRSILDMERVADSPYNPGSDDKPLGMVVPLSSDQLIDFYGTDRPTSDAIEAAGGFPEWVRRGFGVYIVVYDDEGHPSEIYFGGRSYD